MSEKCPTCGGPMMRQMRPLSASRPPERRIIRDTEELLTILQRPGRDGSTRQVFRTETDTWHYTYSGGDHHVIEWHVIAKLVASGALRQAYDNSRDAYGLEPTIAVEATMEERNRTGNRKALVHVAP